MLQLDPDCLDSGNHGVYLLGSRASVLQSGLEVKHLLLERGVGVGQLQHGCTVSVQVGGDLGIEGADSGGDLVEGSHEVVDSYVSAHTAS